TSSKRVLHAPTCAEAADALVEFAVLALDRSDEPPVQEKPVVESPPPVDARPRSLKRRTSPRSPTSLTVSMTGQALVEVGLAPNAAWGGRVLAEIGIGRHFVLRGGIAYAASSDELGLHAQATFNAGLATAGACVRTASSLTVGACAGADVGVLSATA